MREAYPKKGVIIKETIALKLTFFKRTTTLILTS